MVRTPRRPVRTLFNFASSKRNTSSNKDIMSDIFRIIGSAINNPGFLLCFALAVATSIAHSSDPKKGFLGPIFNSFPDNIFVKWILKETNKAFGGLAFLPSAAMLPPSKRNIYLIVATVFTYVVRSLNSLDYWSLSALSLLYFKASSNNARIVSLGAILILLYMRHMTQPLFDIVPSVVPGPIPPPPNPTP